MTRKTFFSNENAKLFTKVYDGLKATENRDLIMAFLLLYQDFERNYRKVAEPPWSLGHPPEEQKK